MIVSNSTPLIYLGKLGYLHLLGNLFEEVIVPSEVLVEVLRGRASGHQEVGAIEIAIEDGWIREVKPGKEEEVVIKRLQTFDDISQADAAAIAVAKIKGVPVCLNDGRAVKVAELMGVNHLGTLRVILIAKDRDLVSKEDARRLILELPDRGFYVSHDLLAAFLEELESP